MLNLFNYLTEEDNRKIENYVRSYGVEDGYIGNENYLKYWAESNKKLFHLLGGQLIYKFPIKLEKSADIMEKEICQCLSTYDNPFYSAYQDFIIHLRHEYPIDYATAGCLIDLTSIDSLSHNKVSRGCKIKLENKKELQITEGGKPMKMIQKVLSYFDAENSPRAKEIFNNQASSLFEEFRIKHSLIFNDKYIHGNLCLSIHPLDFMTMSDNAENWRSCMSWMHDGCYRIGTVEMMNSNNVICAYLEANKDMAFGIEDNTDTWNSKKWRQLFYCTKDILLSGKSYPYHNRALTVAVLEELKKLAKINWNCDYAFGIEKYLDMLHVTTPYYYDHNREWIANKKVTKHNILIDTKGMYNDFFNDKCREFLCYRNKVKKNTILSVSGKAPCLCCGEQVPMYNDGYDIDYSPEDSYNERYANCDNLVCDDCKTRFFCDRCGDYVHHVVYETPSQYSRYMCKECVTRFIRICKCCGEPYALQNNITRNFHIRFKEDFDYKKIYNPQSEDGSGIWGGVDNFNDCESIVPTLCPECIKKNFNMKNIEVKQEGWCKGSYYTENYHVSTEVYSKNDEKIKLYTEPSYEVFKSPLYHKKLFEKLSKKDCN